MIFGLLCLAILADGKPLLFILKNCLNCNAPNCACSFIQARTLDLVFLVSAAWHPIQITNLSQTVTVNGCPYPSVSIVIPAPIQVIITHSYISSTPVAFLEH